MGEVSKFIYDIFFNPDRKIGVKIFNLFAIIIVLSAVDYFFGFSFHYFQKSKLEEIEIITRIKSKYILDSLQSEAIRNEFNKVISREANVYTLFDLPNASLILKSKLIIALSYSWFLLFIVFNTKKLIVTGTKGDVPNNTTLLFQTFFVWIVLFFGVWVTGIISDWMQNKMSVFILYILNSVSQLLFLSITFFIVSLLPKKAN
jgi:hypothetical protein